MIHICHVQASSRSPESGINDLLEAWGAPALNYIEPVFRPPAESSSLILQVGLPRIELVYDLSCTSACVMREPEDAVAFVRRSVRRWSRMTQECDFRR